MKIYRFEDAKNHKGPYNQFSFLEGMLGPVKQDCLTKFRFKLSQILEKRHSNHKYNTHPNANVLYIEALGDKYATPEHEKWVSGFSSLEQAKKWFNIFIPSLIAAKYVLVEYTVKDKLVISDEYQAVFKKTGSTRKVLDYDSLQ